MGAVDAPITSLQSFTLGLPTVYQQGFGDPDWLGWANRYNFFVEDAIKVTSRLAADPGPAPRTGVEDKISARLQQPRPAGGIRLESGHQDGRSRGLRNLPRSHRRPGHVRQ